MDSSFYFNNSDRSFTLIELLVVIAIVGLLASIVLVSMGGLQGKAKITKILQFNQSVDHALGAYAVGWWGFDEGSGAIARDNSGYGNDGTINGAVYTADTPQAAAGSGTGKYALSFDGVDDYVDAGASSVFGITDALTLEAWVYPTGYPGYFAIILANSGTVSQGYHIALSYANGFHANFYGVGDTSTANDTITLNKWQHLVATWSSSSGMMRLYINGVLSKEVAMTGSILVSPNPMIIGWYPYGGSGRQFQGAIDEVRIYEQALSLGEIQKQYAEGLERHQNLSIK